MNHNQGGSHTPEPDGATGADLSGVRGGALASHAQRGPIAPLADSTAITPGRAIPPAEITAIVDRYRHVNPLEAMIPVLQEIQVKFGYVTQAAAG